MKITINKTNIDIKKEPKRCGCCSTLFFFIPINARLAETGDPFEGYYWECDHCKSTLMYPIGRLYRIKQDEFKDIA